MSEIVTFKVALVSDPRIWRRIEARRKSTLYSLARQICSSFGFECDHCFGFYDRVDRWQASNRAFELFADIEEKPVVRGAGGVERVAVVKAFTEIGSKMLFLFDYGEEWHFVVEREADAGAPIAKVRYPRLAQSKGKAPQQYAPGGSARKAIPPKAVEVDRRLVDLTRVSGLGPSGKPN